jgi:hypothetical protein
VVDQQVVGVASIDEVAIVDRGRFEPRIGGLDEDLGLVAGAAKRSLDREDLVPDRVTVPERGEQLVDGSHPAIS